MARLIFAYAALFFWVTLAVAQYDYNNLLKGCYQGRSDDFALGGFARTQPQREWCAIVCSQRGNTFVAFGTVHCFCAKSEPPSTNEVDISRCKAHGLDGWNAPKLGKVNHVEEFFVVFNIDPKRKSDDSKSAPQDESKSSPQSGSPAALFPSAGPSKPLGCYPGLPLDVHLTNITITEGERRECAKSCAEEGKAAVIFSGLKCGCTDNPPEASTRVEDIRCALQSTNKLYRTDLVYSVWSTGVEAQEKSTLLSKGPVGKCFSSRPLTSRQFIVRNNGHVREVCLDRCNHHGYPVALVHDTNCWCAKTYPRRIYSSGLESCDIPCHGDDGGRCGGTKDSKLYYSIYDTEQIDKAPVDLRSRPFDLPVRHETTWHGCWMEPPITEHHSLSIQNNTPARCASYCRRYKSKVAAVRQNSCVCAESYPERSRKRPESLCKSTCPGNPYEDCGGRRVWTVVNTGLDIHVPYDKLKRKEQPGDFNMNPGSKKASLSGCYAEESVTQGAIQVHIGGGRVELCASRCRNLKCRFLRYKETRVYAVIRSPGRTAKSINSIAITLAEMPMKGHVAARILTASTIRDCKAISELIQTQNNLTAVLGSTASYLPAVLPNLFAWTSMARIETRTEAPALLSVPRRVSPWLCDTIHNVSVLLGSLKKGDVSTMSFVRLGVAEIHWKRAVVPLTHILFTRLMPTCPIFIRKRSQRQRSRSKKT
ncbi:hypothetical protein NXS19_006975 [Fusarium pseudograminearum]|nr:hypothetical protein NXS19_006975 [Fusarium pseudograminearum]